MFKVRRFLDFCKLLSGYCLPFDRIIFIAPIGFCVGVLLFFDVFGALPLSLWCAFGALSLGGLVYILRYRKMNMWALLACLVAVGAGISWVRVHSVSMQHQMLQMPIEQALIKGKVSQVERTLAGFRYLVEISSLTHKNKEFYGLKTVRISTKVKDQNIEVGDIVMLKATLLPISASLSPQGYDFRRHAFFQGLSATGFALGRMTVVAKQKSALSLNHFRFVIQKHLHELIKAPQVSAIATALITSERSGIDDEVNQAFTRAGLAHILSISGLHFSILASLVFLLCRRSLSLFSFTALDPKKMAAVLVIITSIAYALVAGMNVPVMRSCIMIVAVMIAILCERNPFSLRLVAFAGVVILFFSPESLFSASFQMSFASVTALISYYEHIQQKQTELKSRGGFERYIWQPVKGIVTTTVLVTLATAPFAIMHFGVVPVYSVVANTLAIPLTALVIMPSILLFAILWPCGLESFSIFLLKTGIEWLIHISNMIGRLPHAVLIFPPMPLWVHFCFLSLFIVGGLLWSLGVHQIRRLGGGIALLSLVLLFFGKPYSIIFQPKPFVLAIRQNNDALFIGAPSSFLVAQWSKAMGVDKNSVAIVPLCQSTSAEAQSTYHRRKCIHFTKERPLIIGQTEVSLTKPGLTVTRGKDRFVFNEICPWSALQEGDLIIKTGC